MADLTITESNVIPAAGYDFEDMIGAAAITIGQAVYKQDADGKANLADADDSAETAKVWGIAVTNCAADGQPVRVMRRGNLAMGAILTQGEIYVLAGDGGSEGGIAPEGDLASGDRVRVIGIATSTTNLFVSPINCDAQVP